jgi:hypothetical protein
MNITVCPKLPEFDSSDFPEALTRTLYHLWKSRQRV